MSTDAPKPVLLSGTQPTGSLTIGNYLGAMKNWVALQDRYDCLFVLVDLHAITVPQDPKELRRRCYDFLALFLACGINPHRSTIFVQSHVSGHSQLAWVLNCFATMGEAGRMTQFKEKAAADRDSVNLGLFDYPVLMAADILLYGADLVPVGEDQKQHLEFTRDLAQRFNHRFGQVFTMPEAHISPYGRIMSLADPTRKMSKTDENPATYIALLDDTDTVRKKIARAVTDSGSQVACHPSRPGISNLLSIYSGVTGEPMAAIEARCQGQGYGKFKEDLAEVLVNFLRPIRERYKMIVGNRANLETVLQQGAAVANERSRKMLADVHHALGFIPGQ